MKKKFTLICVLCLLCFIPMNAELRIYFAYTNNSNQPLPVEDELVTVDYRYGNGFKMNNWENMAGPYNPSSGGFVEGGQFGYRQYGFKVASKTKFSAIHHIEKNATEKTADLTQVNGNWTFHIAIKTNYQGELLFKFQNGEGQQFVTDITDLVAPRNNTWCEVEISMDDFIAETGIDFSTCLFSSLEEVGANRDIWIIQGTDVTEDGEFAWDDCYLTDNGTTSGTDKIMVSENDTKLICMGNSIEIKGGTVNKLSLYSLTGTLIMSVLGNKMELNNLPAGVYIARTDKKSFKFIK